MDHGDSGDQPIWALKIIQVTDEILKGLKNTDSRLDSPHQEEVGVQAMEGLLVEETLGSREDQDTEETMATDSLLDHLLVTLLEEGVAGDQMTVEPLQEEVMDPEAMEEMGTKATHTSPQAHHMELLFRLSSLK
jgi:hypothetical protein